MTTFQLLLLIASAAIFYMFFKQLFNGSHPKRGVDFESKTANEQIGGISQPEKVFSRPAISRSRIEELHDNADEAVQDANFAEAKKALGSALIIDENNIDTLHKLAFAYLQTEDYLEAQEHLENLLKLDDSNDMAHAMLANVLHKLGKSDEALEQHLKAIKIDLEYAPHYFNCANTLYDLKRNEEALAQYKKAYELDPSLDDAKEMIGKLSEQT